MLVYDDKEFLVQINPLYKEVIPLSDKSISKSVFFLEKT